MKRLKQLCGQSLTRSKLYLTKLRNGQVQGICLGLLLCIPTVQALTCQTTERAVSDSIQSLFSNVGDGDAQWLGGDGDTSIPLDDNTLLWAFGDTFYGQYSRLDQTKQIHGMTHDSLARLTDLKNTPQISFYLKQGPAGTPTSFFKTTHKDSYFWMLSGTMVDSTLVLGLAEIQTTEGSFKIIGSTLALVDNPKDNPTDWHVTQVNLADILPADYSHAFLWTSGLVYEAPNLVLVGSNIEVDKKPAMVMLKIDKRELLSQHLKPISQTYSEIKNLPWMTEFSTLYLPDLQRWLALYIPPFGTDIHFLMAKQINGPWKRIGFAHHIPAPWSTLKRDGKPLFISYAPKLHPGLGFSTTNGQIHFTFSYVNNLNTFEWPNLWDTDGKQLLQQYPLLYTPRFVDVVCQ